MSKVAHTIGALAHLYLSDKDWSDALNIEKQYLNGLLSEQEALRQLEALIQY